MIQIMLDKLFGPTHVLTRKEGDVLFDIGDAATHLYQVVDGQVHLERHLDDGRKICQQRAGASDIVAEASLYTTKYHCSARCVTDTILRGVPKQIFTSQLLKSPDLASEWAAHLAHSVQHARLIGEIRSLRSVADKLDAWLAAHPNMPEKGQWQTIAHDISVSREALYRELAKRRD